MTDRRRVLVAITVPLAMWAAALALHPMTFWGMVFDDSFYYWQIARHLAEGHGSTFDGIHPTNGYHPLWMLLCTILFAVGLEGETAARASLFLQLPMLGLGMAGLVAALAPVFDRHRTSFEPLLRTSLLVALALLLCSKDLAKLWLNGIESGLVVVFQGALLALATRVDLLAPQERRARAIGAVLLVATFLARTDGAFLLPAITFVALPRLWREPVATFRALVELLGPPSLVVLAFMGMNMAWMGAPVQVSGLLKRAPLVPWRIAGAAFFFAAPLLVALVHRRLEGTRTGDLLRSTAFFGTFCSWLVGYYVFLQIFARLWYFGPIGLWGLMVAGAAAADILERGVAEKPGTPPAQALRPLLLLGAVLCAGVVLNGVHSLATGDSTPPLLAARDAGVAVSKELPRDAVLASWDAGVIGFYADRPVVNLDGVVNSGDFYRAVYARTTAELLKDVPIGWILNHEDVDGGFERLQRLSVDMLGPRAEGLVVRRTWPFEIFASINGAMPEAHVMQMYLLELPARGATPSR